MLTISYHQQFQLLKVLLEVEDYPDAYESLNDLMSTIRFAIQIELTNGYLSNDMNISFMLDLHFDNPTKRYRAFDGLVLSFKRNQNLRTSYTIPMYSAEWAHGAWYDSEQFAKRLVEELSFGLLRDWKQGKSYIDELTGLDHSKAGPICTPWP